MRTNDLIDHLVRDMTPVRRGIVLRALVLGVTGGVLLSALVLMMTLKPRADLQVAMTGLNFWMKFGYTASLAMLGLWIVERQARAGANARRPLLLLAVPVVALVLLAAAQLSEPRADAASMVMGTSWTKCPWAIVALSLPVFIGLFAALRRLAPTRLTMAGAAAGLAAGASAATVYGFHCTESAAPFILIWYSFGIALATAIGALTGRWALRW